jgi:hypothetical protein
MVSLAFEQRAIPLVWRCYRANSAADDPPQGQVLLVWQLLHQVINVIGLQARPIVEMDRGMAHSEAMLRALKSLGVSDLVRVKSTARFTRRRGHSQLLKEMIRLGEAFRCQGYLFKPQKRVSVELVMVWEHGQREPWCLVTNDRTLTAARYARRMWQEQGFRDLKSGGWPWESSHLRHPDRMERYLLVLALAYAWMLTLGSMSVAGSTPI